MSSRKLVATALLGVVSMAPVAVLAQVRPPVTTSARAAGAPQLPGVPTGPLTATTKAAAAVRASRMAQANAASGAAGAAGARTTSVVGYLWTANSAAIPNATVHLRNTVTGQVEMFTQTNSVGAFSFANVDSGQYVIEYATDSASQLAALGSPFTVAPGETVATFVRLSSALPATLSNVASNVATTALQTAASAGVTTIVTPIAPVEIPPPPPSSGVR